MAALCSGLLALEAHAQPGACCFPNGQCSILGEFPCTSHGGIFRGSGTTCAACGPVGSCCFPGPGGAYCEPTSQAYCAASSGVFWSGPCVLCGPCYANCDGSTTPPVLNVNDFVCFQTQYFLGSPAANCDGSTQAPVLDIRDFICFQTKFAQGCL